MSIQQNSMKNLRGHFSRKQLYIALIGARGPSAEEFGLSNGARIAGFYQWFLEIMWQQVWQKSPLNKWFIQKWRVKDLKLNRLITYREGRESSYFTSWNRRPSLDVPRFPASPLGHSPKPLYLPMIWIFNLCRNTSETKPWGLGTFTLKPGSLRRNFAWPRTSSSSTACFFSNLEQAATAKKPDPCSTSPPSRKSWGMNIDARKQDRKEWQRLDASWVVLSLIIKEDLRT